MKKIFLLVFLSSVLFTACGKEDNGGDLSDIIAIITMPTSTEDAASESKASQAYDGMPQGIPIVVDVDKSPIRKDPLDKGPFVNITKAVAHLGLPVYPDSLWGEWEFDTITGAWKKVKDYQNTDSTAVFRWFDNGALFKLVAQDFVLDPNYDIIHAAFHLFIGDSDELAWLVVDTMAYNNGNPTYVKFAYDILSLVNVTVLARSETQHHLREPHLFGTVDGIVQTMDFDTIYTYVHNATDLSQRVSVSFNRNDKTYGKDIDITAPDSIPGYMYRNISGIVYSFGADVEDTIGILEGKIWHPQDAQHKNYLDIILNETGERIHLWN